jgi:predicted dehydrogenase
MKRRNFVKAASVTGAGIISSSNTMLWGKNKVNSANDKVRIGVVGIHGMGQSHIQAFNALENVEVVALCDIDERLFDERIKKLFLDKNLPKPKKYTDYRKMLEDKDIDAVTVVTPNHWHTPMAIWAMQAGKHVTVEKPCCHTFEEGQMLVRAAQKYNVIVQDGDEQRSNPCGKTMADFLKSGGLGEVYYAKGMCYKRRDTIGTAKTEPVPEGVHYDMWMGPAPSKPFTQNRFHYNWHWQWDYGCGDMGNQGVHEMDVARWGLGVGLPTKISAIGGHFMFKDDQETPNSMVATFEFDNPDGAGDKKKMMVFEVRHWDSNPEGFGENAKGDSNGYMMSSANNIGNLFYGSKGYMVKDVDNWRTYMGKERIPGPTGSGEGNHYQNFIDAIRANDPNINNGKIEEGVLSSSLIHLANISYRVGRSLDFDPVKKKFVNDTEADALLSKEYRAPYTIEL